MSNVIWCIVLFLRVSDEWNWPCLRLNDLRFEIRSVEKCVEKLESIRIFFFYSYLIILEYNWLVRMIIWQIRLIWSYLKVGIYEAGKCLIHLRKVFTQFTMCYNHTASRWCFLYSCIFFMLLFMRFSFGFNTIFFKGARRSWKWTSSN